MSINMSFAFHPFYICPDGKVFDNLLLLTSNYLLRKCLQQYGEYGSKSMGSMEYGVFPSFGLISMLLSWLRSWSLSWAFLQIVQILFSTCTTEVCLLPASCILISEVLLHLLFIAISEVLLHGPAFCAMAFVGCGFHSRSVLTLAALLDIATFSFWV